MTTVVENHYEKVSSSLRATFNSKISKNIDLNAKAEMDELYLCLLANMDIMTLSNETFLTFFSYTVIMGS
mgnify:CR=1 FL=1